MPEQQTFTAETWADAEVTPSPVRLAMEEAERKKAEKQKKQEGVKPVTEQETDK